MMYQHRETDRLVRAWREQDQAFVEMLNAAPSWVVAEFLEHIGTEPVSEDLNVFLARVGQAIDHTISTSEDLLSALDRILGHHD